MAQTNVAASSQSTKELTQTSVGIDQCESNIVFSDVSPKTTQEAPAVAPEKSGSNESMALISPFPDQTPTQILSKEYQIDAGTISSSFTGAVYNFPDALLQIDAIDRIVSMYRYFKAGVQIDVRITPSIYHQGTLMVASCPGISVPPSFTDTIYRLSGFSPVILSYSSQQQATVTMNWNSPFPFYDTTLVTDSVPDCYSQIGSVVLAPLTPYRDLSNTGSFAYRVYAKFLNPHVAGPLPVTSTSLTLKQRTRKPSHQSGPGAGGKVKPIIDVEEQVKSSSSTMVSKQTSSPLAPIMGLLGEGASIISTLGSLTGLFDKPTSASASSLMTHKVCRDFTQTSGLDFSTRLSQYPQSGLAATKMFHWQYTSHAAISEIAQVPMLHHIAAIELGSMPSTHFSLGVHPSESGSSSYAAGQWDYFTYISRATKMWRGSVKYYFKFICPTFNKARFRISLTHNGVVITGTKGDLFMREIEVSGDTDVRFTVPFLYNRFWEYSTSETTGTPILLLELVDNITGGPSGATPIIDVLVFRSAGPDIMFADLSYAYTNPPTSLSTHTLTSGTTRTTTTKTEIIEHQSKSLSDVTSSSLREVFSKPFDSLVCDCSLTYDKNYCTTEHLTTVQEVLKRYSQFHDFHSSLNDIWIWPVMDTSVPISNVLWFSTGLLNTTVLPAAIQANAFQYFLSLFLYVRGDVRIRFVDKSASSGLVQATLLDTRNNQSEANSLVLSDLHTSPELAFEVPYSSPIPWHPIQGPIPCASLYDAGMAPHFAVNNGAGTGFTGSYLQFMSASDNFMAAILMPPPRVWPPPTGMRKKKTKVRQSTTSGSKEE